MHCTDRTAEGGFHSEDGVYHGSVLSPLLLVIVTEVNIQELQGVLP